MDLVKQELQRPLRLAQCRPFTWLLTLLLTVILVACAQPAGEPGVEALPTDTPRPCVRHLTPIPMTRKLALDWAVIDLTDGPIWQLVQYGPADELTAALEETQLSPLTLRQTVS
jgi:hypothetical protein